MLPTPGIGTHVFQTTGGRQPNDFKGIPGVSITGGNVAGTSRATCREPFFRGFLEGRTISKTLYPFPVPRLTVKHSPAGQAGQRIQRLEGAPTLNPPRECNPHAGSIRRGIIIPHIQIFAPADCHLSHKRGGDCSACPEDLLRSVRWRAPTGLKYPQNADPPRRIATLQIPQDFFNHQLRASMGLVARGMILGQRQALRIP